MWSSDRSPGEHGDRRATAPGSPWARLLVSLPDRLVLALFWTCLVVAVTVLVGRFSPWLVGPLLAVVLVATWRAVPAPLPATRNTAAGAAVCLGLCAAWALVHLPYASEYVTVTRDPGFLTLEGLWLADHATPEIPQGRARAVAEAVPGAQASTSAFFPSTVISMLRARSSCPACSACSPGWGATRPCWPGTSSSAPWRSWLCTAPPGAWSARGGVWCPPRRSRRRSLWPPSPAPPTPNP
ncbi:hypothetical protein [Cellulomonas sp. ATA003]|uniref:hypothetical protein n=1 Tax=Cellulomonas sp. ATA003 TaxID=3073064 RepID=UPI002873F1B2|nr:hypothetical protein [Cellulomonas sp. ATA003]WNB86309.1 hypothetical protein REH70_03390 [Cellulomonas sp. ATA003]